MRSRERDCPSAQQRAIVRRPRENTLRIGTSQAIPAVLRSLGFDPAEVLSEVGVDLKVFDDADNRISFATRGRLVAHCVAVTGCKHSHHRSFGMAREERTKGWMWPISLKNSA